MSGRRGSGFRQVHGSWLGANGWQEQWDRVNRWIGRVRQIGYSQTSDTHSNLDILYAFFMNCYHLRDWIAVSGLVDSKELDALFETTELQVCRDICNGTKHLDIRKPSVDADFSIVKEYLPSDWPSGRPQIEETYSIICGEKYNLFELAEQCLTIWQRFLTAKGLT